VQERRLHQYGHILRYFYQNGELQSLSLSPAPPSLSNYSFFVLFLLCLIKLKTQLKKHPHQAHERHTCPRRIVVCPNKCSAERLQARAVPTHLSSNCRRRFVSCPEKCGRSVISRRKPRDLLTSILILLLL
jgi:hypothetical protein